MIILINFIISQDYYIVVMRQVRQNRITSLHCNKQNETINTNSSLNANLPSIRNNKLSLKNEYQLNLHQRKKTYLNLCTKKQFVTKNNPIKNSNLSKKPIETARVMSDQNNICQASGTYLSSRGDKTLMRATTRGNGAQKYIILQNHQINIRMRARMVDWLIQIAQAYKCKNETLFLALYIMDRFFDLSERSLQLSQLHLIGVTCIYMACKYQEIHPIRMKTIVRDIAHNKISASQIIAKQGQILNTLSFKMERQCLHLKSQQLLYDLSKSYCSLAESSLKQNLQYYVKLIAFDCDLLYRQNIEILAKATILASIRSLPEHSRNLQFYDHFISICGREYEAAHLLCSKILFLNLNFKTEFGQLENIHKICPIKSKSTRQPSQSCML